MISKTKLDRQMKKNPKELYKISKSRCLTLNKVYHTAFEIGENRDIPKQLQLSHLYRLQRK